MKLQLFVDKECEEQILIYTHQRTPLTDAVERLVSEEQKFRLVGYKGKEILCLDTADVYCFIVECNKIYAITKNEKLQLKLRLYQLEEHLGREFIKINQSCIANIKLIERFDASISGTLTVKFKNGHTDYVSRRNIKNVKERLGL